MKHSIRQNSDLHKVRAKVWHAMSSYNCADTLELHAELAELADPSLLETLYLAGFMS